MLAFDFADKPEHEITKKALPLSTTRFSHMMQAVSRSFMIS